MILNSSGAIANMRMLLNFNVNFYCQTLQHFSNIYSSFVIFSPLILDLIIIFHGVYYPI